SCRDTQREFPWSAFDHPYQRFGRRLGPKSSEAVRFRFRPKLVASKTGRRRYCYECRQKALPAEERKGVRIMPDNVAMFATLILLLPMFYLLLAAPAFLLVKLDIRPVALLLRAMFNGYFLTLAIAGAVGTIVVAAIGRPVLAMGIALIAAFAVASRRWFLRQMDAQISERDPGDADAAHRLRRLHWGGMLSNAIQLAVVVACIPYIAVAPT